jgi:hypothetical protein
VGLTYVCGGTFFHIAACPACGSTRALAAFFHGHIHQALAYNRNVVLTAPGLLLMLVQDLAAIARRPTTRRRLWNASVSG